MGGLQIAKYKYMLGLGILLLTVLTILIMPEGNITGMAVSGGQSYTDYIKSAAEENNLPYELVLAQMQAESNYKTDAVSPVGAAGLIQLMPYTAEENGIDKDDMYKGKEFIDMYHDYNNRKITKEEYYAYREQYYDELIIERDKVKEGQNRKYDSLKGLDARFDPETNIDAGVLYLSKKFKHYKDSQDIVEFALAAYNTGEGNVDPVCCPNDVCKRFEECKDKLPTQTQDYVAKIMANYGGEAEYFKIEESQPGVVIGKYKFDPKFYTEFDYDFEDYKKIKDVVFGADGMVNNVKGCNVNKSVKECVGIELTGINADGDLVWKTDEECLPDKSFGDDDTIRVFCVESKQKLDVFDETSGKVMEKPIVYNLAVDFS